MGLREEAMTSLERVNSEVKKYKTAPLQYRDLLEKLFDGLSAIEDFARSSGMASVPSTQQTDPVREPTLGSTSRTQVGVRTQSKGKRSAAAVQLVEPTKLVQSLISVLIAQGSSSASASNDDTSFEVLKVLKDIVSSYVIDNTLFFKSLKFLGGSNENTYRLMFLGLDPEQRVGFLEALGTYLFPYL
ncbi:hypothetical protein GIB67_004755 [Kingdonia uniflora]|uniref:Uncharacterized protein n=1 Tax=Kingdonia uniflora TaxID=39325 RepID=A0A7J7NR91_9MAGN|nr:hypothetical protein GIB67_004755 [Kingdonia uniflora]